MRVQEWFRKKGHRSKGSPLENDTASLLKSDKPRRKRLSFTLFNSNDDQSGKNKKNANHNRTESNETSLTHALTFNTEPSYSGEARLDSCYIGESSGSYEVLSPHHMIQYGKSLLELEEGRGATDATMNSHQPSPSNSEMSSVEGLSCIMEDSSRETESDSSIGIGPKARLVNSSNIFSSQWDAFGPLSPLDYIIHDSEKSSIDHKSSQMNVVHPRMILMDGSMVSPSGASWVTVGSDPVSRHEFITKKSKSTTEPPLGINNSITPTRLHKSPKKAEAKSVVLLESVSSPQIGFRSDDNSIIENFQDEKEPRNRTSIDGSSDRNRLLKPRHPIKKTHRRSSSNWFDFFSRPSSVSGLDETSPSPVYKFVAPALLAGTPDQDQILQHPQEKSFQKLADGTVRFEI